MTSSKNIIHELIETTWANLIFVGLSTTLFIGAIELFKSTAWPIALVRPLTAAIWAISLTTAIAIAYHQVSGRPSLSYKSLTNSQEASLIGRYAILDFLSFIIQFSTILWAGQSVSMIVFGLLILCFGLAFPAMIAGSDSHYKKALQNIKSAGLKNWIVIFILALIVIDSQYRLINYAEYAGQMGADKATKLIFIGRCLTHGIIISSLGVALARTYRQCVK